MVSIADDGGSSGRIRSAIGGPAPGDLRRCFEALGDGSMLTAEMGWRFSGGELDGHALGNLLIAGLIAASDDLVSALDEMCRLVDAVGRVLPATSIPVDLVADTGEWEIEGQVAVHRASGVVGLRLDPPDAAAPPETIAAIESADHVVLGPGSFLTSVLAATLSDDVRVALGRRTGPLVLVANLTRDREGPMDLADHVHLLNQHGVLPDVVLMDELSGRTPPSRWFGHLWQAGTDESMIPYCSERPWRPATGTCDPFLCRKAWSGTRHRLGMQGLVIHR